MEVTVSDAKSDMKKLNQQAVKYDQQKTEYHYMSSIAIEQLNKVLSFGAKKYAAHNWRGGMKWTRVVSAALRHLFAWLGGETYDKETGLNHLAHCMCCLMFLLEFEVTHPELDDRYKPVDELGKMLEELEKRDPIHKLERKQS